MLPPKNQSANTRGKGTRAYYQERTGLSGQIGLAGKFRSVCDRFALIGVVEGHSGETANNWSNRSEFSAIRVFRKMKQP